MAIIKPGQLSSGPYNISGSFTGNFTGSLSGVALTASYATQALSSSFATTAQTANTASYVLNAVSASYAGVANSVNTLNQNVLISGSLTVVGNSTFYGSSSFVYITASQLDISASFISVNVFEPVERFGGLIVYDSGSSLATASLAWDSLHNHWVYQNVSGASYTGGMLLSGPRNTGSLGDEPNLTKWFIPRGDGGDHLDDSQIFSSGSTHIVTGSLTVTQGVTGSLLGTASYSTQALSASFAPSTPAFPFTGSALITGSLGVTGSLSTRAQGSTASDIAFRVRNSVDTADLISFRGNGSQWIQSVPFIHAGNLTGGTNAAQSLYVGYNSTVTSSIGTRNTIIGTGTGNSANGNEQTAIGWGVSTGGFNTSIAIGAGAILTANNQCVIGSETYPFNTLQIGTGGTVTSAAAVQNMIFSVGGVAGGYTSNTDLSSKFFRIQSQGGSGTGNGAPIQFSVAPSGTAGFTANNFVIPLEIRGDAAGLNYYQLATPRIPTSSLTDGYIQYSADRGGTAGKASPHFRTEDGTVVWLGDESRLFNVTASAITASLVTATQIGAGAAPSGSIRLDVRAQGALSTDIALRVRNSADNKNIIEVRGDGETRWPGLAVVGNYVAIKNYTSYDATIDLMGGDGVKAQIFHDVNSNTNLNRGLNIWNPGIAGSATAKINNIVRSGLAAYGDGYGFNWAFTSNANGTYTQAERAMWLTHQKSLVIYTGSISPTTDIFNEKGGSFEIFASASAATGGVAAHFITNAGTVTWIGNQSRLFNVTASSIVASGSITVGTITSTPSTENTLNVYPPLVGGTGEGGQILLAASGGLYTSASMLDNWQNQFRLLKGTNTGGSTAGLVYVDLQNGNTNFVGAVTASAYSNLPNAWLHAVRNSSQTIGSGTWADRDVVFNTYSSNNFTYNSSTGIATLRANKTYRITARLAWSAAGLYTLKFRLYNQTTSTFTGPTVELIQSPNGTFNVSDNTLETIFAVGATDVDVSIRTTSDTNALTGEFIRGDLNTQLIIQQIA